MRLVASYTCARVPERLGALPSVTPRASAYATTSAEPSASCNSLRVGAQGEGARRDGGEARGAAGGAACVRRGSAPLDEGPRGRAHRDARDRARVADRGG